MVRMALSLLLKGAGHQGKVKNDRKSKAIDDQSSERQGSILNRFLRIKDTHP